MENGNSFILIRVTTTVGWPDLLNKNTQHPVKFESQINKEFFLSISISQIGHGTYLYNKKRKREKKKLFYLTVRFNWVSCSLPDYPTALNPGPGHLCRRGDRRRKCQHWKPSLWRRYFCLKQNKNLCFSLQ